MAYTTVAQIRRITNLTTSDISDADLTNLITDATAQLNSDINTRVVREKVVSIDLTRENKIDGSNTIYYVQNWKGKYIADMDDDGGIDTGDVIVYQVASDGTETKPTISAVDSDDGYITLSSAPSSGVNLYITYEWCFDDPDTPSPQIALACAFLTAAYAYEKINRGMSPQQVYGNVRFMRDMRAGNEYYQRYENQISKINSEMGDFAEAEDM
jgi:hypothetical protein